MSRSKLTSAFTALLLVAMPACDEALDQGPVAQSWAVSVTVRPLDPSPSLEGQVVLEGEDYAPLSQAQVLVELVAGDDRELSPIELTTDAEGRFQVPELPEGVVSMTTHIFYGGEHAGSETVPVVDGEPTRKAIVVIAITAGVICIATTWASARKISGSDKLRHCVASCRTARYCGVGSAFTAGTLKEMFDSLCQYGPQWLKNLLSPVSGCGGWDSADMAANTRGIACALRWKTCENCCNDYY